MKQIIDGLKYDTDKANEIGHIENGGYGGDFSHWSGILYKTKRSGRYFLAGSGGPKTMFVQSCGQNSICGSTGIIVLSSQEALDMAEMCLDADVIEQFFDVKEA